jgi:hypothetical protein
MLFVTVGQNVTLKSPVNRMKLGDAQRDVPEMQPAHR